LSGGGALLDLGAEHLGLSRLERLIEISQQDAQVKSHMFTSQIEEIQLPVKLVGLSPPFRTQVSPFSPACQLALPGKMKLSISPTLSWKNRGDFPWRSLRLCAKI
jgi:hypothetical protein